MRRATALALLLLTAAAPPGAKPLPLPPIPPRQHREPHLAALPLPPLPPRVPPGSPVLASRLQPAPLPDRDKFAPPRERLPIEAAPAVFWPLPDMQGDGFLPGSTHQLEIERPSAAVPGVKFTVPID